MFINLRREPGSSFVRQRRNLMGVSVGVILYHLLQGKIKDIPTILGAVEIHNSEYVEFLFVTLMLYFSWRFYVYRKLENDTYLHDINDSLNKNLKFINTAKEIFAIHSNNVNIRIGFNDKTYVFIDVFSINCKLRI